MYSHQSTQLPSTRSSPSSFDRLAQASNLGRQQRQRNRNTNINIVQDVAEHKLMITSASLHSLNTIRTHIDKPNVQNVGTVLVDVGVGWRSLAGCCSYQQPGLPLVKGGESSRLTSKSSATRLLALWATNGRARAGHQSVGFLEGLDGSCDGESAEAEESEVGELHLGGAWRFW